MLFNRYLESFPIYGGVLKSSAWAIKCARFIAQQSLLKEQRQKLILEKAALRSLKRIEHIASSQLNLVKPNPEQVIILRSSQQNTKERKNVQ